MKTYENFDEAVKLYHEGLSIKKIEGLTGIPNTCLHRRFKKMGITRDYKTVSRKYQVDDHFFDEIDTEEKAYWLGFLYADGYVTTQGNQKKVGVALKSDDHNHLEQLRDSLSSTYPVKKYKQKSYGTEIEYSRLLITSDRLYEQLTSKGVVESKSLILTFPSEAIVPQYLVHHFIRGYFDGDGSLAKDGDLFKFKLMGTQEMLNDICDVLQLGERKLYQRRKTTKNTYSIEVGGRQQVINLMEKLYDGATIYLQRKYERYKQLNHSPTVQ